MKYYNKIFIKYLQCNKKNLYNNSIIILFTVFLTFARQYNVYGATSVKSRDAVLLICKAIENKKMIQFIHKGFEIVGEVHVCGFHIGTGKPAIRLYKIRGNYDNRDISPWQLFFVDDIQNLQILSEYSNAPREDYNVNDAQLKMVFCAVEPPRKIAQEIDIDQS